jgi:hypothetical protein
MDYRREEKAKTTTTQSIHTIMARTNAIILE